MRPVPESKHILAVAVFAILAAGSGYLAMVDDQPSDAQVQIATAALKHHQGELFTHDLVYGASDLWRFHPPAVQAGLETILVPSGYRDPLLPFRLWTGPAVMLMLCGMYALLYKQTRAWSISAFVAILSCVIVRSPGGGQWGIGTLGSVTPAGMCLAASPLILLAFRRYERRWQLVLVFGFIGLLGNLHLVTAMNLTAVLLLTYLARQRLAPSAWLKAFACGVLAAMAALPYSFYYFALRASLWPQGAATSYPAAVRALAEMDVLLYPDALRAMLDWDPLVRVLLLATAAVTVLWRLERYRARNLSLWTWLLAATAVVGFGAQGASEAYGRLTRSAPPVVDFIRILGLLMLPLYVLLAQAMTNLFRLAGKHRWALRWACAALIAAWILPSENSRVIRHAAYAGYDTAVRRLGKPPELIPLLRYLQQKQRHAELEALGQWAQTQSHPQAIFIAEDAEFRMLARRAIVASRQDIRYFYYLAPWRLEDWLASMKDQNRLLHPHTGAVAPAVEREVLDGLAAQGPWQAAEQWYAVLPATVITKGTAMTEIVSEQWGRYYHLYRLR